MFQVNPTHVDLLNTTCFDPLYSSRDMPSLCFDIEVMFYCLQVSRTWDFILEAK